MTANGLKVVDRLPGHKNYSGPSMEAYQQWVTELKNQAYGYECQIKEYLQRPDVQKCFQNEIASCKTEPADLPCGCPIDCCKCAQPESPYFHNAQSVTFL